LDERDLIPKPKRFKIPGFHRDWVSSEAYWTDYEAFAGNRKGQGSLEIFHSWLKRPKHLGEKGFGDPMARMRAETAIRTTELEHARSIPRGTERPRVRAGKGKKGRPLIFRRLAPVHGKR